MQTVTTVFNTKTTCITHVPVKVSSVRIDLLDETIEETNKIIDMTRREKKLEGNQYTYGNLYRDV